MHWGLGATGALALVGCSWAYSIGEQERVVVTEEHGIKSISELTSQPSEKLKALVINDPTITGTFTGIAQWPNLESLRIVKSSISGNIPCPPFNGPLVEYTVHSMGGLSFPDCVVPEICNQRLVMSFDNSNIKDPLPRWLLSNWCISWLSASGNQIPAVEGSPDLARAEASKRQSIHLYQNALSAELDPVLCSEAYSWDLESRFHPCPLTNAEMAVIIVSAVVACLCFFFCCTGLGYTYYRRYQNSHFDNSMAPLMEESSPENNTNAKKQKKVTTAAALLANGKKKGY